ncbi:TIGR02444 family protein [Neptunomonas sp.]|uniref:TIGR02444 family protein n=1 Tax=Neptunomonas sp. TaxID=1971898 RepID=UPI0035690370
MQLQNPLWAFALKFYSYSEVEECCLALQNEYGMSINRLLYAAWLATQHKLLDTAALQQSSAQHWQHEMTHPLRALRYRVRNIRADEPVLDAFYVTMRKAELEAERIELAYLYALAQSWPEEVGSIELLMKENVKRLLAEDSTSADTELVPAGQRNLLASFCRYILIST